MAWAILKHRECHFMISMGDLDVIVALMLTVARDVFGQEPPSTEVQRLCDEWRDWMQCDEMLETGLDTHLADPTLAPVVVRLLEKAKDHVTTFGETIPGEYLTTIVGLAPGCIYRAAPTSHYLTLLRQFREFVQGIKGNM